MYELFFDSDVSLGKGQRSDCVTQMPPDLRVIDFGFLPRDRYPLVAVLTLANAEDRGAYDIVSNTHTHTLSLNYYDCVSHEDGDYSYGDADGGVDDSGCCRW